MLKLPQSFLSQILIFFFCILAWRFSCFCFLNHEAGKKGPDLHTFSTMLFPWQQMSSFLELLLSHSEKKKTIDQSVTNRLVWLECNRRVNFCNDSTVHSDIHQQMGHGNYVKGTMGSGSNVHFKLWVIPCNWCFCCLCCCYKIKHEYFFFTMNLLPNGNAFCFSASKKYIHFPCDFLSDFCWSSTLWPWSG